MTTRTYEAPPHERTMETPTPTPTPTRTPTHRREERSDIKSFAEAEPGPKPLAAFDVPPASAGSLLTW
jgi:hypothetical protein